MYSQAPWYGEKKREAARSYLENDSVMCSAYEVLDLT